MKIPELSLVVLVGVSGAGKSTFAARHFVPTEVLSSDAFRGMVADDPDDQSASAHAFDALHHVAGIRLRRGRLTVVDATSTQPAARASLIELARSNDVLPVAIVLDLPERLCAGRSRFGREVVGRQHGELRRGLRRLKAEGFRYVHVLSTVDEIAAVEIERTRSYNDRRELTGPFDLIGDVHGCRGELETLLGELGWELRRDEVGRAVSARHPQGRTAVFLGDLVDRGPDITGVLRLAMGMVADGVALAVAGNHEVKLVRALKGRDVRRSHGLVESLDQLAAEPDGFTAQATTFMDGLLAHYVLDGGRLVVAHAGLREQFHGRASRRVRAFALYGETTGETDEFGLPVRYPWALEYRGAATVAYGHTPVPEAEWVNNTICLDTGCVFGGALTVLRWPERELVSVAAEKVWFEPVRPLRAEPAVAAGRAADELDVTDVLGKRAVETRHLGRITVPAEQSAAALEVLSRFAVHPRWLVYLPPTMAPVATAPDGPLEQPTAAFDAFAADGVAEVVMQAKHMGSRAVVIVCADAGAARRRFGATGGETGVVLSRTGRRLVTHPEPLLARLRAALATAGLWAELDTDWLALDAELLPWSAAAGGLLDDRYAPTAAAALADLGATAAALQAAGARGVNADDDLAWIRSRLGDAAAFDREWRRHAGAGPVRLAPFCLLAGAGSVHAERPVDWQLGVLDRLVTAGPELLVTTARLPVRLDDPAARERGAQWWAEVVAAGAEGAVVKPAGSCERGRRGLVQPGLKVRGQDYLRLVYGPHYTEPANLTRLRERAVGRKRALALREYALGLEALHRFVEGEPLWRVHQAVAAVLALESQPVDPRL
ncbi:MAG: polynucleotide kinase-phosphatase [Pseudonocardia sp.]